MLMQKTISILFAAILLMTAATRDTRAATQAPQATEKNSENTVESEQIVTSQAATAYERHPGVAFSLGISTVSAIPALVIAPGATVGGGGSITAIFQLTPVDGVQVLFSIPSTQGGLNLGVGALYKHTLFGNESAGFHAGVGGGLGTVAVANTTNFALSLPGLVGIHYTLSGTQVAFHFDGGASFTLLSIAGVNGVGGSTTTNLSIAPFSTLLGASVVYLF